MMAARQDGNTSSFVGRGVGVGTDSRPSTRGSEEQKEIWSNLLKSVSSHKTIPTRHLLVMGSTPGL